MIFPSNFQFTIEKPVDPNKIVGLESIKKEDYKIIYKSEENIPEEFKYLKEDIDETIGLPKDYVKKALRDHPKTNTLRK